MFLCDVSLRMELDELEDFQKRERDYVQMMEEQSAKTYEAYRLHHLLSTKQVSVEQHEHVWNTNKDIIGIKVEWRIHLFFLPGSDLSVSPSPL